MVIVILGSSQRRWLLTMGFVFIRVNLKPEKSLNQFGPEESAASQAALYSYGGRGVKTYNGIIE